MKRNAGYIKNGAEVAGELACLTTRAAADAVDVFLRYYTGYAGPPPLHVFTVTHSILRRLIYQKAFGRRRECPTCGDSSLEWSGMTSNLLLRSPDAEISGASG